MFTKLKSFGTWDKAIAVVSAIGLAVPYTFIAASLVEVPFFSIFFVNVLSLYLIITIVKLLDMRWARWTFIIASIAKLCLLIYNASTKKVLLAGVDWENFHNFAIDAVQSSSSLIEIYNNSLDLFVFFIAVIYKVFGIYANQIFFYILPFSLILFKYVYKTVFLLTDKKNIAVWAAIAVILWPVNFIFSVSMLREIPIQMFVAISFYNFVKYLKLKKPVNLLGSFIFALAAALAHSGMIALVIIYAYVWLQSKLTKKFKLFNLWALAGATLLFIAVSFTPLWASVTTQFSGLESVDDVTASLEERQEVLVATTNYISDAPQSLSELVLSVPYRFVMFAFSPFVWQVKGLDTAVAFLIDAIPQAILLYLAYRAFKNSKRISMYARNVAFTAVLCITMTFLIFSLGTNNYGTAMRHRAKVLPITIVLVSAYYFGDPNRKKRFAVQSGTKEGSHA